MCTCKTDPHPSGGGNSALQCMLASKWMSASWLADSFHRVDEHVATDPYQWQWEKLQTTLVISGNVRNLAVAGHR